MKILQVGKYYYPAQGGIETMLRNLSEGLARAGDQVTVLCSAEAKAGSEEKLDGVQVLRAPFFGSLFSQPLSPTLPIDLVQTARDFDIVHVHSPNPLAESACLALPPRIPIVVSHHSDIVRQKLILPLYKPLLRRFLGRARRIAVATPNHISSSPFLTPFAAKCRVIPYGLDPASFDETNEMRARAERLRAEHGPFLLFVGRLVGYKGVEVLIEAMREVDPDARLLVVGDGPLRPDLERQARDAGLASRVRFLGRLPSEEPLTPYYRAAEFFVLPSVSKNEAFGLVQVEAMACHRPVVSTRLDSGITLVGEDGVTCLQVEPGNARELAGAINRLLGDASLRERMGAAARKRFEERFTRDAMVRGYRDLYREILREDGKEPGVDLRGDGRASAGELV